MRLHVFKRSTMTYYQECERLIDKILPRLLSIRHGIHEKPELALKEFETSRFVRNILSETDVVLLDPVLETDVVGLLTGDKPGGNMTLRADMDALPLYEKTGLPYASKNDGVMHACGHDGHTAMLIGAALVLSDMRAYLPGSVRFVFQPGEEVRAAGRDLVARGILDTPRPDGIVALHAWAGMTAGCIASRPGPMMAAGDFFRVTVTGRGGHGSKPNQAINPITTAARIVEAFSDIAATVASPFEPVVVTVCRFEAGRNANVIPETAEIEGTVRYFSPGVKEPIVDAMKRAATGLCEATGAQCDFDYESPYMPTVNDEGVVSEGRRVTRDLFGESYWIDVKHPSMGAEDFSYYVDRYPGAMFWIGMGGDSAPLHNPAFNFNDDAMKNGVLFLCAMVMNMLKKVRK